ncbi:MAG: hypothetical protein ACRDOY_03120 [Nocardioidaceae bacterium]
MPLPTRSVTVLTSLAVLATLAAVAGCSGAAESGPVAPPSVRTLSPNDSSPVPSPKTAHGVVQVSIDIEDGEVTPSGERVDVMVGQPIRLVVDSDAPDEIHIHSNPEQSFTIKDGADDKEFEFSLHQPGVVEAELHELGDVVVTFAVRP